MNRRKPGKIQHYNYHFNFLTREWDSNLEPHNREYSTLTKIIEIHCPPLNRITLGQHKNDNSNRMIQLTHVLYFVYCLGIMGPTISDYNKRVILLSVIQLSGGHFNWLFLTNGKMVLSPKISTNLLQQSFPSGPMRAWSRTLSAPFRETWDKSNKFHKVV